jgi:hypothetical protein
MLGVDVEHAVGGGGEGHDVIDAAAHCGTLVVTVGARREVLRGDAAVAREREGTPGGDLGLAALDLGVEQARLGPGNAASCLLAALDLALDQAGLGPAARPTLLLGAWGPRPADMPAIARAEGGGF